ncbi:MAG: alpha/beta hydrolase [Actinomycetota bacterium]|nr:alpha/beta hydrolase [Actinomycetota bacterium]
MGWTLLVLAVLGLVHALNALMPTRRNKVLFAWSFFASWMTLELVWHHIVAGLVIIFVTVSNGALDDPPGVIGLVLMIVDLLLLAWTGVIGRRTVVLVRDALADLEPTPGTARFPRLHVVFPFLMNHRKGVSHKRNIEFARAGGKKLRLDVTIPSAPVPGGGDRRPALLQIHGGGWVIGDKREQGLPLLNHMAVQGWVGFNANYRLSPAATFPDHVVDVKRAIAWIKDHADDYGVDPNFICITGGSAGGHLSALAAVTPNRPDFQPGFEGTDTSVAAGVPFYGIYDFTPDGAFGAGKEVHELFLEAWMFKAFVDEEPEKYVQASPLHRVGDDAPAMFVIHGDKDTLAPVEDARTFVARLREVSQEPVAYAEMKGAQHAFDIFPSYRSARVMEGVERFLTTLWERRRQSTGAVEQELAESLTE